MIKPDIKNTGPACIAANLISLALSGEGCMVLIMPSKHLITNRDAFASLIESVIPNVEDRNIVTFNITLDRPEIGYGYLELGRPLTGKAFSLEKFIAKPDSKAAGNYLWNASIFMAQT